MHARLIVADSERNADLLYATGLFVPDPFIWLEVRGKTYAVLSDLEIDRARRCARVDRVLSLTHCQRAARRAGIKSPRLSDIVRVVLRTMRVRQVEVPGDFPIGLARRLSGVRIQVCREAFFPERACKSAREIRQIIAAQRMAEQGMHAALRLLRASRIGRDGWLYRHNRKVTSEQVHGAINARIAALGGNAGHTIVAGGNQACDPHEAGHGPLRAHQPIIIDIFPRDLHTGYWGDLTRTVVRGRARAAVQRLYATVAQAQQLALTKLRAGVAGKAVHQAVLDHFQRAGYPTGRHRGRMRGFFHGTGHGLGLEIHELPRVSVSPEPLQAGHVVTVEPGLYYPGVGGVRLEDVVVIRRAGHTNLTRFEKVLEI